MVGVLRNVGDGLDRPAIMLGVHVVGTGVPDGPANDSHLVGTGVPDGPRKK